MFVQEVADTLSAVVNTVPVETVPVVVQAASDSLANVAGSVAGEQVTSLVTIGLGLVTTLVMTVARKGMAALDAAPAIVKSVVVIAFAQAATWLSSLTGIAINGDLSSLDVTLAGVVVAAAGMGIHALLKALGIQGSSEG